MEDRTLGTASEFVPVPSHTYFIFPTATDLLCQVPVALLPSHICCFTKLMAYFFVFAGIPPFF